MCRVLALLLAWWLPLQFAWGAAAAYCGHEAVADTASHFGHHEHEHHDAGHGPPGDGPISVDDDCGICHACAAPALTVQPAGPLPLIAAARAEPPPLHRHTSAPPRAPDRPQWRRPA